MIWFMENFGRMIGNKFLISKETFRSAFTYSKLTIETLEQGVKYVQI